MQRLVAGNHRTMIKRLSKIEYLTSGERRWLTKEVESYPYFVAPRIALVEQLLLHNDASLQSVLAQTALYTPNREQLLARLSQIESRWVALYGVLSPQQEATEKKAEPRTITNTLVDSLESHNYERETTPTAAIPFGATCTPTIDYASLLAKEGELQEEQPALNNIDLIDSFIEKSQQKEISRIGGSGDDAPIVHTPPIKSDHIDQIFSDDTFLTESLAKIYIKQGRYLKALEIIKKLSLKYPEKSSYFADQIVYLEKLITNIKTK